MEAAPGENEGWERIRATGKWDDKDKRVGTAVNVVPEKWENATVAECSGGKEGGSGIYPRGQVQGGQRDNTKVYEMAAGRLRG
jgi:hypothetical protein